jgi:hypothetical protein
MSKKPSNRKKAAATSGDVAAGPLLEQLGRAFAEARKVADEWAAAQPVDHRRAVREAATRFLNGAINLGRPTTEWPDGITPAKLLEWLRAAGGPMTDERLELARLDEAARALREAARDAKAEERARIDAEHRAAQGQPPKRTNAKGAGRPRTRTQYDAAVERRADLYRRLVKAPAIGKAAGYRADARFEAIFLAVMNDATVDRRGQWRELSKRLSAARLAAPDGGRFRRMRQQFEREQIKG